MRPFIVLLCLLVLGCEAQKPRPCKTPPLLTGDFTVSTQNEKLWEFARFLYDGFKQRIRLMELGVYENKTFNYDVLLLFKEGVMFEISEKNRTCKKVPLKATFVPWQIPRNSSFVGQAILGTSSVPGAGVLINSWYGKQGNPSAQYFTTVTEYGCIPISSAMHFDKVGWVLVTFFNNVIGITQPEKLIPPSFCKTATMDTKAKPVDFFSLFSNKH